MRKHTAGLITIATAAAFLLAGLVGNSHDVPRCIHDDFNDGTQAVCYTVNVNTGESIYIDSNDEVIPAP